MRIDHISTLISSLVFLYRNDDYLLYYDNLKKLGQGASGTVYGAVSKQTGEVLEEEKERNVCERESGWRMVLIIFLSFFVIKQEVALKVAPISELAELTNEIGLQSLTKHNNVVNYLEVWFEFDWIERMRMFCY